MVYNDKFKKKNIKFNVQLYNNLIHMSMNELE